MSSQDDYLWQQQALIAWKNNRRTGIIKAVTSAGKSRLAMNAIQEIYQNVSKDFITTIVVPKINLIDQWRDFLIEHGFRADDISEWSARKTSRNLNRINLMTYQTAWRVLPRQDIRKPHFLILDEVHYAGARRTAGMFDSRYNFTMGLSATPQRKDFGFEEVLLRKVGRIVYVYPIGRALQEGVISDFEITNYGIHLTAYENSLYQKMTKSIKGLTTALIKRYGSIRPDKFEAYLRRIQMRQGARPDPDIQKWFNLTAKRKRLIYMAENRAKVAVSLILQNPGKRIMVFHESIPKIAELADELANTIADGLEKAGVSYALYHSQMEREAREEALKGFKDGKINVILSVKALAEGTNVPDMDIAIIVASTGSLRQRIQTIGRALRKSKRTTKKQIYTIFVMDTSDVRIVQDYWSEATQGIREKITNIEWDTGRLMTIGERPVGRYSKGQSIGVQYSIDHRGKIFRKGREGFRLYSTNNPPGLVMALRKAVPSGGRFYIDEKGRVFVMRAGQQVYVTNYIGKIEFEDETKARQERSLSREWSKEETDEFIKRITGK